MQVERSASFNPLRINSVAFFPASLSGGHQDVTGKYLPALIQAFEVGTSLDIANLKSPGEIERARGKAVALGGTVTEQARRFGQLLGVQGVFCFRISELVDSSGSALGTDSSAHVSFQLWMMDLVESEEGGELGRGKPIWSASFDRRSAPLSDNLLDLANRVRTRNGIGYERSSDQLSAGFRMTAAEYERERLDKRERIDSGKKS